MKKIKKLTTLDDLLNKECGKEGSVLREKFDKEYEAFKLKDIAKEEQKKKV